MIEKPIRSFSDLKWWTDKTVDQPEKPWPDSYVYMYRSAQMVDLGAATFLFGVFTYWLSAWLSPLFEAGGLFCVGFGIATLLLGGVVFVPMSVIAGLDYLIEAT